MNVRHAGESSELVSQVLGSLFGSLAVTEPLSECRRHVFRPVAAVINDPPGCLPQHGRGGIEDWQDIVLVQCIVTNLVQRDQAAANQLRVFSALQHAADFSGIANLHHGVGERMLQAAIITASDCFKQGGDMGW